MGISNPRWPLITQVLYMVLPRTNMKSNLMTDSHGYYE